MDKNLPIAPLPAKDLDIVTFGIHYNGGGTGTATDTKLEYISFATLGNAVGFGAMVSGGGNSAACSDDTRGKYNYSSIRYSTIKLRSVFYLFE